MKMKSELENLNVNVTLSAVSCEVTLSAVSYGACYFPFGSLIGLGKWSLKLLIFFFLVNLVFITVRSFVLSIFAWKMHLLHRHLFM